ncbi:hypothetical protein GPUN_1762 [Glaciecola punicea ACAM 611]|uniref:Uncharacterized protein n=1 Tax=Glaciecola punicea ACAM 611 TaxID=1121923 RepID=H5TC51_9ALTE|nr:hypothetical protein GPUN_1762 [Glaciecola punicea ACAM 611]
MRFLRIVRTASITYLSSISGSGLGSFLTSARLFIGCLNFGPSPASKYKPKPIASGIVRISEKRIAASSLNRRSGCNVTSHANSGLVHTAIKSPASLRTALYSGKYLPAWRIIHTGVASTGCLSNARMYLSFFNVVIR